MPNIKRGMMAAAGAAGGTGYAFWIWGQNEAGMIPDGTTSKRTSPVQIGSETYWLGRDPEASTIKRSTEIGSGNSVTNEGILMAWGRGESGRMGDGTTVNKSSPVQIGSLTDWAVPAALGEAGLAVKTDGTLWSWGFGQFGVHGDGTSDTFSSPQQVGSLTDWKSIDGAPYTVLAIKTDGTLWAWGNNQQGQLGVGDTTSRSSPTQVGSLTTWATANPGDEQAGAIKTDGTLWVWGKNASGQLGKSNLTDYSSPVQVGSLTTWSQLSFHRGRNAPSQGGWMAVKTDGTLWGTGTQEFFISWSGLATGEIGVGNSTEYSSPVQVGSDTDWKQVSAGSYTTIALRTDGTLWSWGRGYYGVSGNSNTTSYSSPQQVGSESDWVELGESNNNTYLAYKP